MARRGAAVAAQVVIKPGGPTLERFLASPARVKFVQGPVRSGKTTAVIHSLMVNALLVQQPNKKGVRRRKTIVVRNTYKQLIDTVIPSIREIMPEDVWGPINVSGRPRRMIKLPGIEWEWLFYAADKPDDAQDFKSLEASDIWLSEYRYLPREIVSTAVERIGHFPSKSAEGCQWPQLVGETNAPMEGHWSSVMSGQEPMPSGLSDEDQRSLMKPEGWEFFIQPPGLIEIREDDRVVGYRQNPDAENVENLNDPLYYEHAVGAKTPEDIRTELLNRPGRQRVGKAVWPGFRRDVHVAREALLPVAGHPIYIGQDFGRTPAAVLMQSIMGRVRVLDEVWAEGMGARAFARLLRQHMAQVYPEHDYVVIGDPAGEHLAEADDISPFLMFRAEGLRVVPAPTNDPVIRVNAVAELLTLMVDGAPAFLVSPTCRRLISAMDGGYIYKRLNVSGERYSDTPDKGPQSHIADACQYGVLGTGHGRTLVTRAQGPGMGHNGGPQMFRAPVRQAVVWRGRGWGGRRA